MDDKLKAAIAGFNFGCGGYLLVRALSSFMGNTIIDGSWMLTHAMIGVVIGIVLAGAAFVAIGQMQK